MKFTKDPRKMTLREYCDCRDDMGRERRRKRPLSYGVHSTDAFIARHKKYEKEYIELIKHAEPKLPQPNRACTPRPIPI